jgi:predicted nucleic acid-binding protein
VKYLFLDTNVVIDFLTGRRPFADDAALLFDAAIAGVCKVYISALSYHNIWYILRQSHPHAGTLRLLSNLEQITEIAPASATSVKQALSSGMKDFEDALQYFSALELKKIDILVTRNTRDFKGSALAVMTPAEAAASLDTGFSR